MTSADLIERMRLEGGFRLLPLLGNTGHVTGVHLTRFLPGGYLDVVQAWDDHWAVWARLPDDPDLTDPFSSPIAASVLSGSFAQVASPLLPLQPPIRHALESGEDTYGADGRCE